MVEQAPEVAVGVKVSVPEPLSDPMGALEVAVAETALVPVMTESHPVSDKMSTTRHKVARPGRPLYCRMCIILFFSFDLGLSAGDRQILLCVDIQVCPQEVILFIEANHMPHWVHRRVSTTSPFMNW